MDADKAKAKRKARGTNTISVSLGCRDPAYEIVPVSNGQITNSGLLVVAELRPKKAMSGLPIFSFRWHEEHDHLNVDAVGVSAALKKKFEKGKEGYGGHLPVKASSTGRTFHATILWDKRILYEGDISIPLSWVQTLLVRVGVK